MNLFPCTLVYVDEDAKPGPNSTSRDPLSYVSQAICLNNSLRRAGMPMLTIMTNAPALVAQRLESIPPEKRPTVTKLVATIELPKNMPFYAAHFKLALMDQLAGSLPADTMLLLLDADMVALLPLDPDLIERCAQAGLGAFDISDQVFPAYGSERVVEDLEIVAQRRLRNPRWYGGEFLLATPASLRRLVPRARASYARYLSESERLRHHGDEAFISAALNALVDDGQVRDRSRCVPGSRTSLGRQQLSRLTVVSLLFIRPFAGQQGAARKGGAFPRLCAEAFLASYACRASAWPVAPRGKADRQDAGRPAPRVVVRLRDARREELGVLATSAWLIERLHIALRGAANIAGSAGACELNASRTRHMLHIFTSMRP